MIAAPEQIYEHPQGAIHILACDERVILSSIRFGPGNPGPAAHIHHHHSDGFFVVDGELTVRLGDEERRLGRGGFVLIPPGVVHTVRNASDADVLMVNLHAPTTGFDEYLRAGRDGDQAARDRFDQHEPPPDGGRPASDATFVPDGEGEHASDGGDLIVGVAHVAPGAPAGEAVAHDAASHAAYVLEGELTVELDSERLTAGPGDAVLVPPGVRHAATNAGGVPVRFLSVVAPVS